MNLNLKKALEWLGLDDENQAHAFFIYLHEAGYLNEELIDKAILYLHKERFFVGHEAAPLEQIAAPFKEACKFIADKEQFFALFGVHCSSIDIVDLIMFVHQTAFDRTYGMERNLLTAKPWMEDEVKRSNFMALQDRIGLIQEQTPKTDHYYSIGVMGASYPRAESRVRYFKDQIKVSFDTVYAVTGHRDLSKGLDREENIKKVAAHLRIEPTFVSENKQEVTKDINETQMVRYLIETVCPEYVTKMGIIDSTPGEWHWRADTTQNAKDFAWTLMQKITQSATHPISNCYPVLLIVEQPYSNRMAKQVRRALNEIAQEYNKKENANLSFSVEVVGKGLANYHLMSEEDKIKHVTQCNSDFAAWIGECYKDARVLMSPHALREDRTLRNPDSFMFMSREKHFEKLQLVSATKLAAPPERYSFVANNGIRQPVAGGEEAQKGITP